MPELLFEIGCEELPPGDVASAQAQLTSAAPRLLDEARLDHGEVRVYATPRRLAIVVEGLVDTQRGVTVDRRGPPVERAIAEDGSFTQAAIGFARSNDLDVGDLVRRRTDAGEYLFAVAERAGEPAAEVLPGVLAELAASLSFDRTMRWDASGVRFPRPVRWLVALLDAAVLPARFGALEAGRTSYGHRVTHPGPVEIESASVYERCMTEAGVVADRSVRREQVLSATQRVSSELGGRAIVHDALLDEVTDLVERPLGVTGRFDPAYLEIPRAVLITAMEHHLRLFAVEASEGGLLPGFVCVSNGTEDVAATIVGGNERVLRARLEDARFFWDEDLDVTLSGRAEQLGQLIVHADLGSMRDKSARLELLVTQVGEWMGLESDATAAAQLAARLCKADLLTQVVYEFPELEGEMGREYALRDPALRSEAGGRIQAVADAIAEHHLPRGADTALPVGDAGAALAVADRIDTLVGYLGIGLAPTGSGDPFALRRQAGGVVQILLARQGRIPIREAVDAAWELYREQGRSLGPLGQCVESVRDMLVARVEPVALARGVDPMLFQAAVGGPWTNLSDLLERAELLQRLHVDGGLHRLAVAHERAYNLSRKAQGTDIDTTALDHPAERELNSALEVAESTAHQRSQAGDHAGVLEALEPLHDALDGFLSPERGVMVMADDERVRSNRLALLARVAALFALVADFSVVIPKELEDEASAAGTG